jgi:hypothetical protein
MLQHTESDVSRISPNMKMRSSIENFRSEISGGLNNIDNLPINVVQLTQAVVDIWRDIPDHQF